MVVAVGDDPHLQRAVWDETIKGHVLNFRGRVTVSSVKNFQLSCDVSGGLLFF